jgi:osmotically-inducible protein OsmY
MIMMCNLIREEDVQQVKAILGRRVRDFRLCHSDGRIVLKGQASTYYAKQIAQHLVWKSIGSRALVNEIEVRKHGHDTYEDYSTKEANEEQR